MCKTLYLSSVTEQEKEEEDGAEGNPTLKENIQDTKRFFFFFFYLLFPES